MLALSEGLKISSEAARGHAKPQQVPQPRANDRKTLVSVDLIEIKQRPLPARSPGRHPVDTFTLKACIDSLQRELAKVEAMAAGHRADFELERDRAEHLVAKKLLKATADTMTAGQATPRLEGALAAPKARPWWRRIVE
jgi:hypothetical protein